MQNDVVRIASIGQAIGYDDRIVADDCAIGDCRSGADPDIVTDRDAFRDNADILQMLAFFAMGIVLADDVDVWAANKIAAYGDPAFPGGYEAAIRDAAAIANAKNSLAGLDLRKRSDDTILSENYPSC